MTDIMHFFYPRRFNGRDPIPKQLLHGTTTSARRRFRVQMHVPSLFRCRTTHIERAGRGEFYQIDLRRQEGRQTEYL